MCVRVCVCVCVFVCVEGGDGVRVDGEVRVDGQREEDMVLDIVLDEVHLP